MRKYICMRSHILLCRGFIGYTMEYKSSRKNAESSSVSSGSSSGGISITPNCVNKQLNLEANGQANI
jgi:hypothetical protein